ncbi:MAG: acyl--CoA ligase [Leptospiraceae bacterium]|nr:acyl--CoA ligase [Leptospiraceae bacterium]MDW7976967.1 class I adenylate-forming enzyme family protein [Leptospiraceae bacterium]
MKTPKPYEFNLAQYIIEKNRNSQKPALIYIENPNEIIKYTYKEVIEIIEMLSQELIQHKKRPFSKVLLRLPSNPNVIFYFFASILAGMIPIPISRMLTKQEVGFIMDDANVDLVICQDLELPDKLPEKVKVKFISNKMEIPKVSTYQSFETPITYSEDPAFMIYTSGTTGRQKGVIHAQRNLIGRTPIQNDWLGIQEDDWVLHSGELNWTYTLGVGVMDVWSNSATSVLVGSGRNQLSLWTWIMRNFPITIFATVPSLYRRLIKYHSHEVSKLSTIRHCLSAGEALKASLWKEWTDLTQKPLYEALGMTEISTYISSGPKVPTKPGSPGKPQSGRNVKILSLEHDREALLGEVGLIAVHRSDQGLMLGYHNREEEEELVYRGEWFVGGDLAYQDEEGYFWFQGRNNDIIKSFGYRVSALEVEKVLEQHPEVMEVAVCEIQKEENLSFITAFIVKEQNSKLSESDVIEFAKNYLAEYKLPRKVIFLKELPRNLSGKVLKQELKQIFDFKI